MKIKIKQCENICQPNELCLSFFVLLGLLLVSSRRGKNNWARSGSKLKCINLSSPLENKAVTLASRPDTKRYKIYSFSHNHTFSFARFLSSSSADSVAFKIKLIKINVKIMWNKKKEICFVWFLPLFYSIFILFYTMNNTVCYILTLSFSVIFS